MPRRGRNPLIEVERIAGTALAIEGVHVPARAVVVECAVVLTGAIVSTDIRPITTDIRINVSRSIGADCTGRGSIAPHIVLSALSHGAGRARKTERKEKNKPHGKPPVSSPALIGFCEATSIDCMVGRLRKAKRV